MTEKKSKLADARRGALSGRQGRSTGDKVGAQRQVEPKAAATEYEVDGWGSRA